MWGAQIKPASASTSFYDLPNQLALLFTLEIEKNKEEKSRLSARSEVTNRVLWTQTGLIAEEMK